MIVLEERARETVLRLRARLIKLWHDNIDDTIPVRILKPDHLCDQNGPTEGFVDETGAEPIAGIYPTCSQCGSVQLPGVDLTRASTNGAPRLSY